MDPTATLEKAIDLGLLGTAGLVVLYVLGILTWGAWIAGVGPWSPERRKKKRD